MSVAFTAATLWVIGQKELVKTAVTVGIPIAAAVLSCFQEDTGRTKRVGKKSETIEISMRNGVISS